MKLAFAEFVLDTESRRLFRRGLAVTLTPKALHLLAVLMENRPRALSKPELQRLLWPDAVVVEANLTNLVGDVRSALGDDAAAPRFIRTLHRFGYAFCGEVTPTPTRASGGGVVVRLRWPGGKAELEPGEHVLGRDPDAAVCLASASVSRHHALVRVGAGQATVEDLGSKNGTSLNGTRIEAPCPLADGDEICAGSLRLTVRMPQPLVSTETDPSRGG